MKELQLIVPLILSLLLGGLLGWNREKGDKPAGLRTYMLVSSGSALFTILSIHAFSGNDPTRIAAQIVSGIGFIGAGSILHRGDRVEGVTTAAGLWIAAAIGMAVGAEFYILATVSTFLIFLVLFLDGKKIINKEPSIISNKHGSNTPENKSK